MPSSVVHTYEYEPDQRRLDIVFTTGRRYSYHGVPLQTFEAMKGAFAKGEFFNRHIRDRFPFTRQADVGSI
jgi:lysyl-tRNA synthetase class 2